MASLSLPKLPTPATALPRHKDKAVTIPHREVPILLRIPTIPLRANTLPRVHMANSQAPTSKDRRWVITSSNHHRERITSKGRRLRVTTSSSR